MTPKIEIIRAMFDVKPVDRTGRVDFEKIERVKSEINLKKTKKVEFETKDQRTKVGLATFNKISGPLTKELLTRELQQALKKDDDMRAVLAQVGGKVHDRKPVSNLARPTARQASLIVKERIRKPELLASSPAAREIEVFLDQFKNPRAALGLAVRTAEVPAKKRYTFPWLKKNFLWITFLAVAVFGASLFLKQINLKDSIEKEGSQAVMNLEKAKENVSNLDFKSAAENFNLAYESFSNASGRLNLLGGSITSFFGDIPGFKKLKSAQNLAKAGEDVAKAGENVSRAVDNLYHTNFMAYLGFNDQPKQPLSDPINALKDSLVFAQKRMNNAASLLAEVDAQVIPENKRESFLDFKEQIPNFQKFVGSAIDYSDFLLEATGKSGPKKYLVLLENNTELRPTGGFPGTYALLDFNRGFLRDWKVDDIYKIDAQAKKNIIPPKELQHITPTWGMRDANWFVNFPDSAKKVTQMFTQVNGGPVVDGVLALTPTVISRILAITGPVSLPQYGKTINSENFLSEIQSEVEYGENRAEPKQILIDFTPKFFELLGGQDKDKWREVFRVLTEAIEQKHLLAYFKNPSLEKVALKNGLGGEVKKQEKDYLMVAHTNIKGSKTDAVTDSSYDIRSEVSEDGTVSNTLAITRANRGGKTGFGFYNRTNHDFVRVLVPKGSTLTDISGHSSVTLSPLVDYSQDENFVTDEDLKKYEENAKTVKPGVKEFLEADKTVFGFWLNVEPGKTKTVTLKYLTPVSVNDNKYSLLVQKQAGTLEDVFNFSFALPDGKKAVKQEPAMQLLNNNLSWQTKLLEDVEIKFQIQ